MRHNQVLIVFIFTLFVSVSTTAQVKSDIYLKLAYNDSLSNPIKETKIDSLILDHRKKDRIEFLIGDTYDFARWQKKYGTLQRSIDLNKECLALIDSFQYKDVLLKKKALYNLAVGYKKQNDFLGAAKYFNDIAEIEEIDNLTFKAYRLRADNVSFSGDYYRAAELYDIAIDFSKEHKKHEVFLDCSVNAALNYRKINSQESLDKGITLLEEAIVYLDGLDDDTKRSSISLTTVISLYLELGILHSDRPDHHFIEGKKQFEKALEFAYIANDSIDLSNIHNGLGLLYLKEDRKEALGYFDKALSYKPYARTAQVIFKNKSKYYGK